MRQMEFFVQKEVLDAGVKIVFAVVEGVDNHKNDAQWQAYRNQRIAELYEAYQGLNVHADPTGTECPCGPDFGGL